MTYLVLARKWRPRSFDTLVGQDHVVKALTHALSTQRLHHAWLFTGTRGVGKTTLSRLLAKSLNCETGITPTPCGSCRACTEIDAGRFVDYVELDAASNRGVDEMTQLLEQAVYAPGAGRFKVYMIDEVHMLSGHAFNAMLKTLEEPPPHVKFILATTDPQKIPVTVLSRCLQFNLKQMTAESIVGHLQHILAQEDIPSEVPALRLLAQAAAGSMRDALSLTDQAIAYSAGNLSAEAVQGMLGTIDNTHLVSLLQALARGHAPGVLAVADHLASRGLSFQAALADLAVLLSRIAIEQRVPGTVSSDDPLVEHITTLAGQLAPDALQLFYTVAVHSRHELSLAPDDYAGFVMACLRMLALVPEGQALPPGAPDSPERPGAIPASPPTAIPAAAAAASAPQPNAAGVAATNSPSATPLSGAGHPPGNFAAAAPEAAVQLAEPEPPAVPPEAGSSRPPPWEDEIVPASPTGAPGPSAEAGSGQAIASPSHAGAPEAAGPASAGQTAEASEPAAAPDVDDTSGTASAEVPTDASQEGHDFDEPPYDDPPYDDESAFDGYIPDDEPLSGHLPVDALPVPQTGNAREGAPRRAPRLDRMTPRDWPELAMALPLTGLAAELARQSEWLRVDGNCVHLRVGIRTLAESSTQSRLRTVLSEHFGTVVQVQVNWGATGDDTAHAVNQARLAALQQQAEQAVANDPLIHTLMQQFDARVLPGSIRAGARAALSA